MGIIETVERALANSGADVSSIGRSVCGNEILCAHCGDYSGKQIIITAAIHARECYTSLVVLKQISAFSAANGGAYFIPLVNPDGAAFFESGATFGKRFLSENAHKNKLWKANADGVDLNCNFDANFGTGAQQSRLAPAAHGYIGQYPLCAPESKALCDFTLSVMPAATVSYHCMGGELYWQFFQDEKRKRRDSLFAERIADYIGVKKVDGELSSAGGYKDYCVQSLKIPAVTVELIKSGNHPFAPSDFNEDVQKNAHLPEFILNYLYGDMYTYE
ncbi:MAG: hypothetical protein J1F69_05490 [Clostridiales bacterium]|nr:hypothetical protein [Clostridiales bacterium]